MSDYGSMPPFDEGDPGWIEVPDCGSMLDRDDTHHLRRDAQRKTNVEIGEGSDIVPTAHIYTLDQMRAEFVFIKDGSQVAPLSRPQAVLGLADFKNDMAGSKHWFDADGKKKARPVANVWLEDEGRMGADALTFRAGRERMTIAPDSGRAALNMWVPIVRQQPPADWIERAQPFVDHIRWLWGDDSDAFLDWLAHIEQRPGVLPHYGWVHISREHGKGRNWISSVLVRVWQGYVAASLDLVPILDGSFNGRMSRKLLAIVDEINEGGSTSYRHAQRLRQIVTEEHREINPKYGRQRLEYNSCRWLMFSNHTGALPLTEDDRRFWIVAHEGTPREPEHYAHLYAQLGDPTFIASVAEMLRHRDIANFKPGARPPINKAKAELVAFGQSEDEVTLRDLVTRWCSDLITGMEITNLLQDGGPSRPATRHAMDRVGIRKLSAKVRHYSQGSQRIYALRNFDKWAAASYAAVKVEIDRVSDDGKRSSFEGD